MRTTRQKKISWLAPYLACRSKGCTCKGWRFEGDPLQLDICVECSHMAEEHGNLNSVSEAQLDQILRAIQQRVNGTCLILNERPPFEAPSIEQIFERYGEWVWTQGTGNEEYRGIARSLRKYQQGCKMCFEILNEPHFLQDLPSIVTDDPSFSPFYRRWVAYCGPGKGGRLTTFFGRALLLHVAPLLRAHLVKLPSEADQDMCCAILAAVARQCMDPKSPILQKQFDPSTPRPGHLAQKRALERTPMVVKPLSPLAAPGPPDMSGISRLAVGENLVFRVYRNDGTAESLMKLAAIKQIFSLQLPKMPREYITRLVFDKKHQTLIAMVGERPIGGICFRPFRTQGFVEVTFCAITTDRQVKGYGSMVMNHLKAHCQTENLLYFLTYADSFATGYFKKQGFSDTITLPRNKWAGYIKDYDGATLMECHVHPSLNYLTYGEALKTQRDTLERNVVEALASGGKVYSGLSAFKSKRHKASVDPESIPGVIEAGWDPERDGQGGGPGIEEQKMERLLGELLARIKQHSYAWPFKEPVDPDEVQDYYEVIKDPVDLQMIEKRLASKNYYVTVAIFVADLKRMVDNCKDYNDPHTSYYKCAVAIETFIAKELKKLGLEA